eukprot:12303.XXX_586795_586926_1 [CDS] Oithona nana genome sequencing.
MRNMKSWFLWNPGTCLSKWYEFPRCLTKRWFLVPLECRPRFHY